MEFLDPRPASLNKPLLVEISDEERGEALEQEVKDAQPDNPAAPD